MWEGDTDNYEDTDVKNPEFKLGFILGLFVGINITFCLMEYLF
jgi:hypothetical protein